VSVVVGIVLSVARDACSRVGTHQSSCARAVQGREESAECVRFGASFPVRNGLELRRAGRLRSRRDQEDGDDADRVATGSARRFETPGDYGKVRCVWRYRQPRGDDEEAAPSASP
jgi:hypothetical protein